MNLALQPVPGFEQSPWAMAGAELIYRAQAGRAPRTEHPRYRAASGAPAWQPEAWNGSVQKLRAGARVCRGLVGQGLPVSPTGLLRWLCGLELAFPLQAAAPRFDAVAVALRDADLNAFEAAALRVLGLGPGLTPSGDDFLGGLLFALHHAPKRPWARQWPSALQRLLLAAPQRTHLISATLLADLARGQGYGLLHQMLPALERGESAGISAAANQLLTLGASSGGDLLAGLLTALSPLPRSLSDLGIVGCNSAAAGHFSPVFCPIATAMGLQTRQKLPSLGPNFASTPQVRQAPSAQHT